jgi:Dimerisation domain
MPMTPFGIMSLVSKFQESRIFLTAAEMDVFTLLAKKPMSAQEIADRLEATVRGVTILLDAVVSMGLLEKKEEKYHCPAEVASIMSKESPTSIMPIVMLATGGWKRWSDLTDIVRRANRIRGTAFDFYSKMCSIVLGGINHIAEIKRSAIGVRIGKIKSQRETSVSLYKEK